MKSFEEKFVQGFVVFSLIGFTALIPTSIWFIILSAIAWGLNQLGLTGEWLHYWKYWWCLGVFILAFIGQVLVAIGGSK